ncbi:MAG: LPS assembly lipoprotein LptE [Planctomycetota bacterium]
MAASRFLPARPMIATGRFLSLLLVLPAAGGCAQYRFGSGTLYAPDVQTVHVPMIESESFRRDLGERLTEAVVKKIELYTPYKVVGTPAADSVLTVRVVSDTRRTEAEDPFDQPRLLNNEIIAQVSWLNRRRLPIGPAQALPVPAGVVDFRANSQLIPAAGQSVATAQQQAIEELADQIVGAMEEPW